ncbi:hypothetical protein PR048_023969 [Dryococelus australis]|uniref:Uncharacterized protein n=1 Tax=Dryococelus australis TaxID=614101 RepID=A0ABQ9GVI8_9NEOP|nr:hypothetical protein PR048_023969 [Dryococelus australis]
MPQTNKEWRFEDITHAIHIIIESSNLVENYFFILSYLQIYYPDIREYIIGTSEAEKCGWDKGETATRVRRSIAPMLKVLKWRVGSPSHKINNGTSMVGLRLRTPALLVTCAPTHHLPSGQHDDGHAHCALQRSLLAGHQPLGAFKGFQKWPLDREQHTTQWISQGEKQERCHISDVSCRSSHSVAKTSSSAVSEGKPRMTKAPRRHIKFKRSDESNEDDPVYEIHASLTTEKRKLSHSFQRRIFEYQRTSPADEEYQARSWTPWVQLSGTTLGCLLHAELDSAPGVLVHGEASGHRSPAGPYAEERCCYTTVSTTRGAAVSLAVRALASYRGKPGSIPGGVTLRMWGPCPADLLGDLPLLPALAFRCCFTTTSLFIHRCSIPRACGVRSKMSCGWIGNGTKRGENRILRENPPPLRCLIYHPLAEFHPRKPLSVGACDRTVGLNCGNDRRRRSRIQSNSTTMSFVPFTILMLAVTDFLPADHFRCYLFLSSLVVYRLTSHGRPKSTPLIINSRGPSRVKLYGTERERERERERELASGGMSNSAVLRVLASPGCSHDLANQAACPLASSAIRSLGCLPTASCPPIRLVPWSAGRSRKCFCPTITKDVTFDAENATTDAFMTRHTIMQNSPIYRQIFASENRCRTMPLAGWFSRGSPSWQYLRHFSDQVPLIAAPGHLSRANQRRQSSDLSFQSTKLPPGLKHPVDTARSRN